MGFPTPLRFLGATSGQQDQVALVGRGCPEYMQDEQEEWESTAVSPHRGSCSQCSYLSRAHDMGFHPLLSAEG